MKKFETPVIEVVTFEVEDIVTASQGGGTDILPDDDF